MADEEALLPKPSPDPSTTANSISLRNSKILTAGLYGLAAFVMLLLGTSLRGVAFPSNASWSGAMQILHPRPPSPRLVLFWNNFFGGTIQNRHDKFLLHCPELRDHCPFSDNQSLAEEAAAIIFHARTTMNPPPKRPGQRFVFTLLESPQHSGSYKDCSGLFDWTMTYRTDSDIFFPYYSMEPTINLSMPLNTSLALFEKKNRPAVLFASNCHTPAKRQEFVTELKKHMDVDVFGGCGDSKTCPRSDATCEPRLLNSDYYFYLALENSVCRDYVTEKFWRRLQHFVIPIVWSRKILEAVGPPPNSFIALDDFASMRDVVDHLDHLMANTTAYMEYHAWRQEGWALDQSRGFCDLCRELLNEAPAHSGLDVEGFWRPSRVCIGSTIAERFVGKERGKRDVGSGRTQPILV